MTLRARLRTSAEWGLAYLAGAWLVVQFIDVVAEVWPISDRFTRGLHVLIGFGLLVLLVAAWFRADSGQQGTATVEAVIIGLLAAVAALTLWLLEGQDSPLIGWLVSGTTGLLLVGLPAVSIAAARWWRSLRTQNDDETDATKRVQALYGELLNTHDPDVAAALAQEILRLEPEAPTSRELRALVRANGPDAPGLTEEVTSLRAQIWFIYPILLLPVVQRWAGLETLLPAVQSPMLRFLQASLVVTVCLTVAVYSVTRRRLRSPSQQRSAST